MSEYVFPSREAELPDFIIFSFLFPFFFVFFWWWRSNIGQFDYSLSYILSLLYLLFFNISTIAQIFFYCFAILLSCHKVMEHNLMGVKVMRHSLLLLFFSPSGIPVMWTLVFLISKIPNFCTTFPIFYFSPVIFGEGSLTWTSNSLISSFIASNKNVFNLKIKDLIQYF